MTLETAREEKDEMSIENQESVESTDTARTLNRAAPEAQRTLDRHFKTPTGSLSAQTNSQSISPTTAPSPEIPRELDRQHKATVGINQALCELADRLRPVLRECNEPAKEEDFGDLETVVGSSIRRNTMEVESAHRFLENLIARLEI